MHLYFFNLNDNMYILINKVLDYDLLLCDIGKDDKNLNLEQQNNIKKRCCTF